MSAEALAASFNVMAAAVALKSRIVEVRRHIHANPELSFQETATARYVATIMSDLGYQVRLLSEKNGLIAEIGEGDNAVGIRADMDALPIQEVSDRDYCSKNADVMHACGHDAHTACAVGAATIIADLARQGALPGKVRFLFQPAEESVNEQGLSGASLMMRQGAVDGLGALFGLHVFPDVPSGFVAIQPGSFLAACDSFDLTIFGKGGHAACPESTVDAVVISAQVIQALQTIVARRKSPIKPAVLSIGGVKSNTFKSNIIADSVDLTGTVRYFDRDFYPFFFVVILCVCTFADFLCGCYSLDYALQLTEIVRAVGEKLLGAARVVCSGMHTGAEDFSFYTDKVPCCFFVLGVQMSDRPRQIHNAQFDVDEDALPIGTAMLTESALAFLQRNLA
mgnify:CR=1 FL=1